jgi:hypothetical protein
MEGFGVKKQPCEFCSEFTAGVFHRHIVCNKCKKLVRKLARKMELNEHGKN